MDFDREDILSTKFILPLARIINDYLINHKKLINDDLRHATQNIYDYTNYRYYYNHKYTIKYFTVIGKFKINRINIYIHRPWVISKIKF